MALSAFDLYRGKGCCRAGCGCHVVHRRIWAPEPPGGMRSTRQRRTTVRLPCREHPAYALDGRGPHGLRACAGGQEEREAGRLGRGVLGPQGSAGAMMFTLLHG